jgi:ATP-binding cassette subfamily B protein
MAEASEFTLPQRYQTDRSGSVRWIFSHASRQWLVLLVALIGAFGNAAFMAVTTVYIGLAFNAVLASPAQMDVVINSAIWIAVTQGLRGLLQFARNFGFEYIAQNIERNIREELYVSLLGKSMTFHNLQPVGDTMARATNDVREVNFLFSPGLNLVIGSLNFLIMPLLLAPRYHLSLLLTPILFVVFYFISLRFYLKTLGPVTTTVRERFGLLNTRLSEALDGIEIVKGSAQESQEIDLFNKNAQDYKRALVKQGDIEARYWPLLLYALALGVGLFHALTLLYLGQLNFGQVVGYFGLLLMLDFPTFTSLFAYSQISLGIASARRILELMTRENNLDQNQEGYCQDMRGEIEFRQVGFGYSEQESILKDISFKVTPGQTVAIVGQTGAGKTSLAKLVNRTYDAVLGQVLIDGHDVRDWNLETLRKNISIIEQDVFLFSKSIRDNIAFGKQEASLEDVYTAAQSAQADDFIQELDNKYETVIGERGVTLSGGQRQRLALARAFLTDPKILILDDSTSAIDSATEDKIQRAIFTAARGRTTLIITHRLSQIRWADLIVVLKKGRIAAIGKHEDLLKSSEAYQKIFSES